MTLRRLRTRAAGRRTPLLRPRRGVGRPTARGDPAGVEEPQSLVALATAVGAPVPAVRQAIESLVEDYDGLAGGPRRGFELREVGGGWRLYVREEHDDLVSEFVNAQAPSRLSQAALETLAVIAYKQPVTRGQVASIRAVNVDSVVRTLVARGLITEVFATPRPARSTTARPTRCSSTSASTRSTSCRTSRRSWTTERTASRRSVR